MKERNTTNPKFLTWIEKQGSYAALGKLLGCSRQSVSNIANGHVKPSLDLANRIAKASGGKVPTGSWGAK